MRMSSLTIRVYLSVIAVLLAANLISLPYFPPPHGDEAYLSNIGYNAIREGRFGLDMVGDLAGLHESVVTAPRAYQVILGVYHILFGNTLLAGRLSSFTGMVVALVFTSLLARRLYNPLAGLAAVPVLMGSLRMLFTSHFIRKEIWLVAAIMGVLYLYVVVRERPTYAGFVALALSLGLAFELHQNIVWFAVPIGLLVLIDQYRTAVGRMRLLVFAATGVVVGLVVAALHFLPDPAAALSQFRFIAGLADWTLSDYTLRWEVTAQVLYVWYRYFTNLNGLTVVFTLYAILGIVCAALQRQEADRILLAVLGLSFLVFAVGQPHKSPFYDVLWDGLAAVLIAAAVSRLVPHLSWPALKALPHGLAALLLLIPLLVSSLVGHIWMYVVFRERDYVQYEERVLALVPEGPPVMGDLTSWYAFQGRNPFTSDLYLTFYQVLRGELPEDISADTVARILDELDVSYVIEDGAIGWGEPSPPEYTAYVAQTCQLVGKVEDEWYGTRRSEDPLYLTYVYDCSAVTH